MAVEIVSEDERIEFELQGSVFILRRMPAIMRKNIEDKLKKRIPPGKGFTPPEDYESELVFEYLDYVIIDWRDIRHPISGENVPCTTEHKRKLPSSVCKSIVNFTLAALDTASSSGS